MVGMEWSGHDNDYDADCLLGLTTDGLTAVAAAGTPWGLGGIAAEWLAYKITGSPQYPVGAYVGDCWNALTANSGRFALFLQCYGEPSIKYWFDNIGDAERWVAVPMCQCHIGCQNMANGSLVAAWKAQARREQRFAYCQVAWTWDFSCALPSPNGWTWGPGPNAPATLPSDEPLPADFAPPWWDTSVPVPEDGGGGGGGGGW